MSTSHRTPRFLPDERETRPKPNHVHHAAFAAVLAAVKRLNRDEVLKQLHPQDFKAAELLTRATATPGSTTTSGWAAEIVQNVWRNFLIGLAPESAAARLIELGLPAKISGAEVKFPARTVAPSTVPWVEENEPIPVSMRALELISIGPARKLGVILTMTKELAKRADGEAVLRQMLQEDFAATLDAAYFSADSGTAARHAGLLNGLTGISGFGGGDLDALKADIVALFGAIAAGGSGQVVLIMSHARAMTFPVLFPDQAAALTVLSSPSVADTRVIAIDPVSLIHGTDSQPDIFAAEEATIHMSDVSLPLVDSGTADPIRDLWQTAGVALRLLADIAFAKRRTNAVAFLDNPTW